MQKWCLVICLVSLSACSQLSPRQQTADAEANVRLDPVLFYSERLAEQLLAELTPLPHGRVTAVTFVDSETLKPDSANARMRYLGVQLQESMLSVATQLGYEVTEFRANQTIQLFEHHDSLLSRDISQLSSEQSIRYVITGTFSQHEDFTVVNARLVDTETNRVIAAVADQIPSKVIGSVEQVQFRQQMIYRNSQ